MSIKEFLEGDSLHLCAPNNTNVDVEGVAILKFCIGSYESPVPFLVTKDKWNSPIIGYKVIQHLMQMDIEELPQLLKETLTLLTTG